MLVAGLRPGPDGLGRRLAAYRRHAAAGREPDRGTARHHRLAHGHPGSPAPAPSPAWPCTTRADRGRLRHRRTELVELAGTATNLPGLAGEPLPAAVFVNAGDWALAQVTIDDRSLAALAEAAFDMGDPLTEAACWNAAWHMVLTGQLNPADHVALIARRLTTATDRPVLPASRTAPAADRPVPPNGDGHRPVRGRPGDVPVPSPLTPTAVQALLGRALTCADRYIPRGDRAAVRAVIADAALRAAQALSARDQAPSVGDQAASARDQAPATRDPLRRALLAGVRRQRPDRRAPRDRPGPS